MTRLNLSTRHYHADVDRPWLELVVPSVTVSDYCAVLTRTYGLVAPFESACRYTPGLARIVDFKRLMRAGLIAQDLLSLGLTPLQVATVPTCPALAMFRSIPEALGWLYVVERSTLLQDGVRRHLLKNLNIEHACAFLAAFEGHVGDHWNAFGRVLDHVAQDEAMTTEIIQASSDAFDACRQWLQTTNSNRSAV